MNRNAKKNLVLNYETFFPLNFKKITRKNILFSTESYLCIPMIFKICKLMHVIWELGLIFLQLINFNNFDM